MDKPGHGTQDDDSRHWEEQRQTTSFISPLRFASLLPPILFANKNDNVPEPNPHRLTLSFGTVGPSPGPRPWVLERKYHWDFNLWLSPHGGRGIYALNQANIICLVLSEEFLYDTINLTNTNTSPCNSDYISDIYQHNCLTPWAAILATLRFYMEVLGKRIDTIEVHVQGLESMSSMSDYEIGQEHDGLAVLRPTEMVYAGFIDEFTKFLPGTVNEVRLSGLFPGNWGELIERRMGSRVVKDLSMFMKEIEWWTTDSEKVGHGLFDFRSFGSEMNLEANLRRRHAEARWNMLNGAGNSYDECESDPGYASDELELESTDGELDD